MDMVTLKRVPEPWFGWMPDWLVAACAFTVILVLALMLQDVLVRGLHTGALLSRAFSVPRVVGALAAVKGSRTSCSSS